MQPITRETIIDRRAPAIRWSAVLAGTAAAVGLWGVFQLIGLGAGLSALDPDDARSLRHAAIGMTSFSALAPLIATFVGGWLAARLCAHSDRKVAASHGLVVWGLTTVAGLIATLWMASTAAIASHDSHRDVAAVRTDAAYVGHDDVSVRDTADRARDRAITRDGTTLTDDATPGMDKPIAAAKRGDVKLDAEPAEDLSAPKVMKTGPAPVAPPAPPIIHRAGDTQVYAVDGGRIDDPALRLYPDERAAVLRAKQSGHGLLTLGISILLAIGTAILGAFVGVKAFERRPHTTAPYRAVDETL